MSEERLTEEQWAEIDRLNAIMADALAVMFRAVGGIQETERWYEAETRKLDAKYGPKP